MIVGFSRHGKGKGSGPVEYLINEKRSGRANSPPTVLRGNPQNTRKLIDSLKFVHKYTSGVLSFAPGERITEEMEEKIMDRFEKLAFAGLAEDQYNILWVRHSHAGHHELHFVAPRVELSSGKSLNMKPPGERTQQHFDDFRSEINARYGLSDPTDPDRTRNVASPAQELKIAAQATRNGNKPPDNMRELIDAVLTQRAVEGLIRNRDDVLSHAKELGLEITRAGKEYITVSEPNSGQRWRLKGPLYARDYNPRVTIEKSDSARERDYSRPDEKAAKCYAERVDRHLAARAEYHQSRYPKPDQNNRMERVQKPVPMAEHSRPEPLSGIIRRELGDDALLHEPDHQATAESPRIGISGGQNTDQPMRGTAPFMRADRSQPAGVSEQLQGVEGVLNDRVGNPLIERIKEFRAAVHRAVERIRESSKRFIRDVQGYIEREFRAENPSFQLAEASKQLEHSAQTIIGALQREQALMMEIKSTQSLGGPRL